MARTFYRKKFSNYLGEQRAVDDIVLFFTADIGPTPSPTPSITPTNTPTPSITPSSTPIISVTSTPTPTTTQTQTPTVTNTQTPTPTLTQTPTSSGLGCDFTYFVNSTPTPTITSTPTLTPTDPRACRTYSLVTYTYPTITGATYTNCSGNTETSAFSGWGIPITICAKENSVLNPDNYIVITDLGPCPLPTPTPTTTLTTTPTLTPTSSGLGCDFTYFVNPTPTPTITSTSTPTPTPAVIPPPQNGMLLGVDASDPDCYPGSGTTVYNLAPSQTTGTTFSDVSWNTNYFGFVETATSKIEFNTNSYNITGTAWTYIMYFMPLSSNSAYLAEKSLGYDSLSLVYGYNGETCRPWMNSYRGMNPVSAPVNELTFVAFTKDTNGVPNNYKSYRNGVLQQEFSEDFSLGAQSGFVFNNFDPGQYRLYNFYFYERALTSQEINDIYSYVTS